MANLDQILCVVSLALGKGCLRFLFDKNSGFHGNRKRQLTNSGENEVFTLSLLFVSRSFSNFTALKGTHFYIFF